MPRRNWGSAVCPPRVLWGDRFVGHGVALCQSEGWPGMERVETEGLLRPVRENGWGTESQ